MPTFISLLSEYVLQTDLFRGCKITKFTTFSDDTNESTVEHIARYLTEACKLSEFEIIVFFSKFSNKEFAGDTNEDGHIVFLKSNYGYKGIFCPFSFHD